MDNPRRRFRDRLFIDGIHTRYVQRMLRMWV